MMGEFETFRKMLEVIKNYTDVEELKQQIEDILDELESIPSSSGDIQPLSEEDLHQVDENGELIP